MTDQVAGRSTPSSQPSTAHLTWVDPTKRTDGTALDASAIAFIRVLMSSDNGVNYAEIGHAAAGQQMLDYALPAPGTYLFKLECVDTQSPPATSDDTAPVSVKLEATDAPPNPPEQVAVQLV